MGCSKAVAVHLNINIRPQQSRRYRDGGNSTVRILLSINTNGTLQWVDTYAYDS
jgi:hypothetical protein